VFCSSQIKSSGLLLVHDAFGYRLPFQEPFAKILSGFFSVSSANVEKELEEFVRDEIAFTSKEDWK
jgi:hypothetical protein